MTPRAVAAGAAVPDPGKQRRDQGVDPGLGQQAPGDLVIAAVAIT
jgi:hypothetical protein